jgi:hypothetical protein
MLLDIDRPLGATQFPQGGVFPLVRQRQLAAGIVYLATLFRGNGAGAETPYFVGIGTGDRA